MSSTREYGIPNLVPKTGQVTSYASGDDGALQKGRKTLPRYIDNGDGTVLDQFTGLTWLKNPARSVTGNTGLSQNNTQVARGNWANATTYSVGDAVKDPQTGKVYVCLVGHTTITDATVFPANTPVTINQIFKDVYHTSYWVVLTGHVTVSNPPGFNAFTAYSSGDAIQRPAVGDGNEIWQCSMTHTSVADPNGLVSNHTYNNGDASDIVKGSDSNYYFADFGNSPTTPTLWYSYPGGGTTVNGGDLLNGLDGNAYVANYGYSVVDFYSDLSSGFISFAGYGQLDLVILSNATVWQNLGTDLFSVELLNYPGQWTDTSAVDTFDYDRFVYNTSWNPVPAISYQMAGEIISHPTYWKRIYLAYWAGDLTNSAVYPFATIPSIIAQINSEGLCGHSDWRWPNVNELLSLYEPYLYGGAGYANSVFGLNASGQAYGSSTTAIANTLWHYMVQYPSAIGSNGPSLLQTKLNNTALILVRGG